MASQQPQIAAKSAHFRDKTPQMAIARKIYFKIVLGGSVSLILAILAIFSIYWGALWKSVAVLITFHPILLTRISVEFLHDH